MDNTKAGFYYILFACPKFLCNLNGDKTKKMACGQTIGENFSPLRSIIMVYLLTPAIMERGLRRIFADKNQERPYRPPATSPNSPKSGRFGEEEKYRE
jgi:hypothetical protein